MSAPIVVKNSVLPPAKVADWASLYPSGGEAPQLLIRDKRILHGLPSGESDFLRSSGQEQGF
jgi:hypothetical protein